MIGLIRAEFRKLFSTQVWFWMLLTSMGLTALGVLGQILSAKSDLALQHDVRDVLTSATAVFTYVPLFVLGVLAITTEYRYQTITPTVLATPSRWALVTAKMITYAILGVLYSLACLAIELAMALPWLSARHVDVSLSQEKGALGSVFVVLVLFALVGLGVGALIKNQIVAVAVGVIFILILDRLFVAIPGVKYIFPYTLSGAVGAIVTRHGSSDRVVNGVHLLAPVGGIAVLIVWALVTAILGAGLTMNRDIT
ncbi:MAG: ABC transporter permease [Actinobacteria bacterium]|nr:ABC transporter permease [Actinomycetota bacterium]